MSKVTLPQTEIVTKILFVSHEPMALCRLIAEKQGIKCDQVLDVKEFSKTNLSKYSVVVANTVPKFSGNRADKYTLGIWTVIASCYKKDIPVCVYSEMLSPPAVVTAYRAGAFACFSSLRHSFNDALTLMNRTISGSGVWIDDQITGTERDKIICTYDDIFCDLTDVDIDLIYRLRAGQSYQDIAVETGKHEVTPRNHVSRLVDKTGLKNKAAVLAHAEELGMQSPYTE